MICLNCKREIPDNKLIGTANRNHCPFCLWSRHLDLNIPGDRKATCHGLMEPIGITFKDEGFDKWGKKKQGEIMLIHKCMVCGKISKNRIAGDDEPEKILEIEDSKIIREALFGKADEKV
jgi:DNA-directed RNA polymerase subunit RPC12/RpoP